MFKRIKKMFATDVTSTSVSNNSNMFDRVLSTNSTKNISYDDIVLSDVLFSCITMITNDISKLPLNLIENDAGIQSVVNANNDYNKVLNKPNEFQNIQQFLANWAMAKLKTGNTYVLKNYVGNTVKSLYVLDSDRVTVAVTPNGEIFYKYRVDTARNLVDLSNIIEESEDKSTVIIPSRYIIHDRFNCLNHPLLGVSPIAACMLAATQNVRIQQFADAFFKNNARPGGILVVENLDEEKAKKVEEAWRTKFSGGGSGQLAVFGDDVKYTDLSNSGMSALDAQLVEQFAMSASSICRVFHIAPFLVGVGAFPTVNNVESMSQSYYSQTLQTLLESIELSLSEGLGIGKTSNSNLSVSFDLDALLRMDMQSKVTTLTTATSSGIMAPNEARARLNLKPVDGGDTPYLQQQNYSLSALNKRDQQEDAFATKTLTHSTTETNSINKNFNDDEDVTDYMLSFLREQ
ncbi:phage portal protein [Halomonas sp. ISL-60]|uniref:phage portal protein n=1 Tax=Halomonas sp. ISL-56 TaxID=2819149 RepID=UPI001BE8302F|nr:phage portal protein [Halomonas sp. ISL-56]MBT2771319.1 phage portal protein [Halomonas sp. ISL-60]MBT2800676.1 phage portal protein [Halomonas sp. ISL-56]